MNKSNLKIIIIDNPGGSYFNSAYLLAPYFEHTFYYIPNFSPFINPALDRIGTGYEAHNITRITNLFDSINDWNIAIFPDNGWKDLACYFRSIGKMVFGGSPMEAIEASRSLFNELLQRVDLPVASSITVGGLNNLRKALRTKKDVWVKISNYRWLAETYHWIDWNNSNFWLNDMAVKLGPLAIDETIEFQIQQPIDAIAELGTDGYTLNGQQPATVIFGIETKDCGYVARIMNQLQLPEAVKEVNSKFSPVLKAYQSNGFYSTEIRYTAKSEPFYTDICARGGCPPLSSMLSNIRNWDEIIPAACQGKFIEPKYKSTYMVEIIIKSNYVKNGWLAVTFPPEFEDNITFKGALKDSQGKVWIVPFDMSGIDMCEFGSVIVNDNNLDNAIERALAIAEQIDGYEIRYEMAAADISKEAIDKFKQSINLEF